jgi:hypothetical protein
MLKRGLEPQVPSMNHRRVVNAFGILAALIASSSAFGGCFGAVGASVAGAEGGTSPPHAGKDQYPPGYGVGDQVNGPADTGAAPILASRGMVVDDITCADVTAMLTTMFAPDGHTWNLVLAGQCGALGLVTAYIAGKDEIGYPQLCSGVTFVRVSVGGEGDAGALAYDASGTLGSCTVGTGPSTADESAAISLVATVESGATGTTHRLVYVPDASADGGDGGGDGSGDAP